ncbi:MAG: hypothetical protein JWP22_1453, partial [Ramlibacter sp.]|nr:hypothetical protein [Ramlibacter sp.]
MRPTTSVGCALVSGLDIALLAGCTAAPIAVLVSFCREVIRALAQPRPGE